MHDPKFEKDVQRRMEELSFTPPEAVWLNVEKAVRTKEKKRRILPFWLFLVPAVLLIGTGGIYLLTKTAVDKGVTVTAKTTGQPSVAQPAPSTGMADRTPARGSAEPASATGSTERTPAPGSADRTSAIVTAEPVGYAEKTGASADPSHPNIEQASHVKMEHAAGNQGHASITPFSGKIASRKPRTSAAHEKRETIGEKEENSLSKPELKDKVTFINNSNTDSKRELNVARELRIAQLNRPFSIGRDRSGIRAAVLSSTASKPAKVELPRPKHPWEAGFTAHIGASSINQGLLDKLSVTSMDYRNSFAPVVSQPRTYTSSVQPDLSFAAGIFLQKGISKNWGFSIGLNLHYYSSRIKTGGMVTAPYASISPSLLQTGTFVQYAAAVNYPYYAPGDRVTYTNRYYFMELPASAIWQIGHSRTLPMFLEGGVSVSYLVASNSLYYEPKAGVFYKDGSMINRTQVGVFSGLMFGLPVRELRIQAGPQLQYGLSNLMSNTGAGNQHLMYGGIKLVFMPGKPDRSSKSSR